MPVPYFTISADGRDVSSNIRGAGISMTITDNAGMKEDTLQIVIDDPDGSVVAPRRGAVLNPRGGYQGRMRDFGLYSVDTVSYTGWPQQISISAKSVASKSLAKQREPKSYPTKDYPTYGEVFEEIAGKIGLSLKISSEIRSLPNPSEHQTEENGLEFLTRLGEKLNATISVKANQLCVVVKGQEQSASGGALARVQVARGVNLLKYSASEHDEPQHSEVEATYYDRKKNKRETVTSSTGLEGPKFLLRNPFQEKGEAQRAAVTQADDLVRATGDASFEIDGDPFVQSEAHAVVSGCRDRVDGLWRIESCVHQFSSSAPYTTALECTAPSKGKAGKGGGAGKAGGGESSGGSYQEAGAPSLTGNPSTSIG